MSSASVALTPCKEPVALPGFMNGEIGPGTDESIMIYLAVSGNMIPMRVLESDSIESVKLRIQSCKGFVVKNQRLVYGGRELARSSSLVRDYGVSDGNVLHLVLRLSDLQVITVRTTCGEEFTFHVERFRDVGYVKEQVARKRGLVDMRGQKLICNGEELDDERLLDDICKGNDATLHFVVSKSAKVRAKPVEKNFELSIEALNLNVNRGVEVNGGTWDWTVPRKPPDRDFCLEQVVINPKIKLSSAARDLIDSTFKGLEKGNYPIRSSEGSGGVYFMRDPLGHKSISVFKPIDEEPMAVNNPQGLPLSLNGEGLKRGTRVGEGALREVAAYILDHPRLGPRSISGEEKGFAGVPPTVMVKCLHRGFNHPEDLTMKYGSLQLFIENLGSCEDMGPKSFPVEEVHKISVLDIRLANADRHAGNILMRKGDDGCTILIPIDHGYCLPNSFEDCTFDWLYWPQAREPYSADTVEYIRNLDAEQDIALLKFHGWDLPNEYARTLRISTMLLKKGVERGLTPFTIGNIMCRETLKKESVIEEIVKEAKNSILPGTSEAAFLESVSQIMDRCLNEITT
ncbi:Phosphatidylinositol 3-/4-kinase, catalytic domain [Dillenia turbinata]|uniref:1-phosphatidylinositol 4-kinase n=1 Tax=Dillenia turbinata TaxID=194707 RepID=A0AAN8UXS3_9MAGN